MYAEALKRSDALPAVAATTILWIEVAAASGDGLDAPVVVALLLAAVLGASIATRRTAPLTSYAVSSLALAAQAAFVFEGGTYPFANLVVLYAVGQYAPRRLAWTALPVAGLAILAYFVGSDLPPTVPLMTVLLWASAWFAGMQVGRRRAEEAEADEQRTRAVLAEERTRLARDLHDEVGHAVTVMLVQAGAARRVLDRDPAAAARSLEAIEQLGARTMVDLDALLGRLRGHEEPPPSKDPTAHQRGAPSVDDLVARHVATVREAGLDVALDQLGTVPDALQDLVNRIVQEALTNVVRHAYAGTARVVVQARPARVVVVIEDDGRGLQAEAGAADHAAVGVRGPAPRALDGSGRNAPGPAKGSGREMAPEGRGIRGMRERLAAAGGWLDLDVSPMGGVRLRAELPLDGGTAAGP